MIFRLTLLMLLCLPAASLLAVEPHTDNTFRLSDGEAPPDGRLSELSWLVGSWTCTAFGKQCEEIWSAPSAGSMVGTFKLYDDSGVSFYELMLLTRVDGVLTLRVKHFGADMSAWEDKQESVDFRLVAMSPDAVHFSGLSFYRRSADQIDGYIVMSGQDGVKEELLRYQRMR